MNDSLTPPTQASPPPALSAQPEYTKLPGKGKSLQASFFSGERQHLFESADHLLLTTTAFHEEKQKKFYYTDIQAITLESNHQRTILCAIWGLFTFGLLMSGAMIELAAKAEGGVFIVFAIIAVVPGLAFLVHLLRGPTCTVRLHTAVQVEELTCLRHIRVAKKTIAMINERIQAVQGLWPESLNTQEAWSTQVFPASSNTHGIKKEKPELKVIKGRLHKAAFIAMFIMGLSLYGDMVYMHDIKNNFDSFMLLTVFILLISAVIRQHHSTLPAVTRRYTWVALIFLVLSFFFAFIIIGTLVAIDNSNTLEQLGNSNSWSEMPWWEQIHSLISGASFMIICVLGLLSLSRYRVVQRVVGLQTVEFVEDDSQS